MKDANNMPVYAGLYAGMAEVTRKHGYALAIHGSMARDFDLVCIPWVETASEPQAVVDDLVKEFALKEIGKPEMKPHRRWVYTLRVTWGECFLDLSFTTRVKRPSLEAQKRAIRDNSRSAY